MDKAQIVEIVVAAVIAYADAWTKYETELPVYEMKKKEFDAAQAKAVAEKKDEIKDDKKDDKTPAVKKPDPPKAPEKPSVVESFEASGLLLSLHQSPSQVHLLAFQLERLKAIITGWAFHKRSLERS